MKILYIAILVTFVVCVVEAGTTQREPVRGRSLDGLRESMKRLQQRMKDMGQRLKDKMKDIAEQTKHISSTNTFNSASEDIWAGHGSILTISSNGNFISSSMNSNRVGATPPAGVVDLTHDIDEATCSDVTVLENIKVTVCGGSNRCKTLTTTSSVATICPGSLSISSSSGSRTMIGNGGSIIVG